MTIKEKIFNDETGLFVQKTWDPGITVLGNSKDKEWYKKIPEKYRTKYKKLGIKDVLATKTDKDGHIIGKNCKGEEKVKRLVSTIPNAQIVTSYSDSESDLPILNIAKTAYVVEGNKVIVNVGEVEHPMIEEHFIEWVSLQTKQGNQRKVLNPGEAPKVCFAICEDDEVEAVYAYCNLHGLWKK